MEPKLDRRYKVDREELHESLWKLRDRLGRVNIYQKELAEDLGVNQATMCRIMASLRKSGKIKKISAKRDNVGVYVVRDPDTS